MSHRTPADSRLLPRETGPAESGTGCRGPADGLRLRSMVDASTRVRKAEEPTRNAEAPWQHFSSGDYWQHNYARMQPEDQEIIRLVSLFFGKVFAHGRRAQRAIDIGSGANLYPALLMLPWTDQVLLTDYSASNVRWLRQNVMDHEAILDGPQWPWQSFWQEMQDRDGYSRISAPGKELQAACASEPGRAGIEQHSVFGLPKAQWQVGTMFFVAESITEDPAEFRAAVEGFVGALEPGAPFAATFMAGSDGYPVADTRFPALSITRDDVTRPLAKLGVSDLSVQQIGEKPRVRPGYEGMIVATGIAGG
jgi:NNMT/PNMT/TEMT family